MPDNEGASGKEGGARGARGGSTWPAVGIVALAGLVPVLLFALGYAVLSVAGVQASRAMSLSGLVTVGAAGAWGLAVGILRIDERLFRRNRPE